MISLTSMLHTTIYSNNSKRIVILKRFAENPNIKGLTLDGKFISQTDAQIISTVLTKCNYLERVDLSGITIDTKSLQLIEKALLLNPLHELNLGDMHTTTTYVSENGINAYSKKIKDTYDKNNFILRMLQLSSLEMLWLNNNNFTLVDVKVFLPKLISSNIKLLNISCNQLGDDGVIALMNYLPDCVQVLNLSSNNIGHFGAAAISKTLNKKIITELYLNNNNIGNIGACLIGDSLGNLEKLSLSQNNIGNKGIMAIADSLQKSSLLALNINHNKIENEGAIYFFNKLPASEINCIDFIGNKYDSHSIFILDKVLEDNYGIMRIDVDDDDGSKRIEQYIERNCKYVQFKTESLTVADTYSIIEKYYN